MPWKPPAHQRPPHDWRVEACRDRAASLRRDDGQEATLYCRVDTVWTRIGGHLWWQRWSSPKHQVEGFVVMGDDLIDFSCSGEDLRRLLDDFDLGVLTFQGAQWQTQWLGEQDSRRVREQHGFESHLR